MRSFGTRRSDTSVKPSSTDGHSIIFRLDPIGKIYRTGTKINHEYNTGVWDLQRSPLTIQSETCWLLMHNTDTINGVYTKQRVLFNRCAVKLEDSCKAEKAGRDGLVLDGGDPEGTCGQGRRIAQPSSSGRRTWGGIGVGPFLVGVGRSSSVAVPDRLRVRVFLWLRKRSSIT